MKNMRTGVTGLLALCALSVGLFAVYRQTSMPELPSAAASFDAAPTSAPSDAIEVSEHRDHLELFPEIDESSVTSVTVNAEDTAYEFLRDAPGDVSVNGQKADSEAFDTLLCQIVTLPVSAIEAFSISERPQLTVYIVSGGVTHSASFYRSSSEDTTWILCGTQEAPLYRKTSAWRVGTLLLTCEGTRIQDESGNETPAE
ncbi:MAG: hypothetical protein Q4G52_02555 [Clostridia bacterium]|nr:hypothetical protein [Clostridia bacterium]